MLIPAVFLSKVALGALTGCKHLVAVTCLNVGRAMIEAGATYVVLSKTGAFDHDDFVDDDDRDDANAGGLTGGGHLAKVGAVSLAVQYAAAVVGVVLLRCLKPTGSDEHIRLCESSTDIGDGGGGGDGGGDGGDGGGGGGGGGGGSGGVGSGTEPGSGESPTDRGTTAEVCEFYRDASDMIVRSLCLQSSVWALAVCAGNLGSAALAAHQVLLLLWMLTSYIVDGLADLGWVESETTALHPTRPPLDPASPHSDPNSSPTPPHPTLAPCFARR